jgi:nucleoside-diphosphate-sugar epimerase
MANKYLVLGSSGQIGSFLVKYLQRKGHIVETFDIVDGDVYDLRISKNKLLEQKLSEVDFVFFLAFDVGGSRYLTKYQNTFQFIQNNIQIMSNTFDLLKKYNKKFIFTSTQMANMSHSSYGLLKSIGERYTDTLGGLVVKLWNVYGAEKDYEKSHVITDFIIKADTQQEIDMISDGTEERQFLYVEDCCECLLTLAKKYDILSRDKEYDISSFKWNTINEVASVVALNFGNTKITPSKEKDNVQQNKKNEPNEYILNFWKPKTNIEDGIRKIIKEMKNG